MNAQVYTFGMGGEVSWVTDKAVVGGKGAGLMEMTALGLPVPPGFIIPIKGSGVVGSALDRLLGAHPIVSVRSGAPVSMPGMMDTVLNLSSRTAIHAAVRKVLESAQSERALAYKRAHGLPADMGTAIIVQAMVHGDKDTNSGTGVVFTRNPSTGKKGLFGEWLHKSTGEDLVAGLKTPKQLAALVKRFPAWYEQLDALASKLERHFKDMQDIEWTVESGKLWLLQTRTGKRTAQAAVQIALDLATEGLVAADIALSRVTPEQVQQLSVTRLPRKLRTPALATGQPIVAGTVTGRVCGREDMASAIELERPILYTPFTEPADYPAMQRVAGFITQVGGATSHAAVVARELGKPCIVGIGEVALPQRVTMCGSTGVVVAGEHAVEAAPGLKVYEQLVRKVRA